MSVNSVSISGNLTRDPELRATQGGTQVLSMGVAVNERVRSQSGDGWEDRPSFVDVTVFGNRAVALSRILAKGAKVAVHGRLRQDRWTDAEGRSRSRIEVVADEVDLMQRRREAGTGLTPEETDTLARAVAAAKPAAPAPAEASQAPAQAVAPDLYDEDIPF